MEGTQESVEGVAQEAASTAGGDGAKSNGRKNLLIGVAAVCLVGLVAGGVFLFRSSPSLGGDPISAYREVMDRQSGFKCLDGSKGDFVRKSDFTLDQGDAKEMANGGFVTLIEYPDADAALVGHEKWSENASQQAGIEEKEIGDIRVISSRNGDDYPEEWQDFGTLSVLFGKFRFESYGYREKLDDLLDDLGYLDSGKSQGNPFPAFAKTVQASGITSQTTVAGYSRQSSYEDGNFVTECLVFWDARAADKDFKNTTKYVSDGKDAEHGTWKVSRGRGIWWITEWTGEDGERQDYYVVRVYRGKTMIAASAPLAQRKEVDRIMRELTK